MNVPHASRLAALLLPLLMHTSVPAQPQPAGGPEFVARLRVAAALPDPGALADLTQLPFLFEGRAHDRRGFVDRVAPALFTPAVRACLARARPQPEDGRLVLWCKPYAFYLGVSDGRWRLQEFAAGGEG